MVLTEFEYYFHIRIFEYSTTALVAAGLRCYESI